MVAKDDLSIANGQSSRTETTLICARYVFAQEIHAMSCDVFLVNCAGQGHKLVVELFSRIPAVLNPKILVLVQHGRRARES